MKESFEFLNTSCLRDDEIYQAGGRHECQYEIMM